MLNRTILDKLAAWKETKNTQGLLLTGARQVGKTSVIEAFAAQHYDSLIKIDFVERPEAVDLISQAKNLDDLLVRITALASNPIGDRKTLLFFDEVQRCGDSITWMRYLANDPRLDVVYSGSMLGVEAFDFRSLPVGTIDILEMFPMTFREFTLASGFDDSLWQLVESSFRTHEPVPDFIHNRLIELYYQYALVGGMPEAVQTFVSTRDTQAMRARQRAILDGYHADITRYVTDPVHAQRIKTIFDAAPAQLNKENKRYIISGIDKKRRFEDYQSDFDWLTNAGVVLPVKRANEALFPLGLEREDSFFKLYLNDVGLLFSTFSDADVLAILERRDQMNFGQIFENITAQEMRAHGRPSLYYFNKTKVGEVDFLIEDRREPIVIPVEVKSGKSSHSHAALDHLMDVKNYHLGKAVVLHRENIEEEGRTLYLPLYMASLL